MPQHLTIPLASFDMLPRCGVAQVEQVGVSPAHLGLQLAGDLLGGKLGSLFRNNQLESQVQQQVTDLAANLARLSDAQCVIQFQHLLDQVGTKRFAGLGPIPGAPVPQIPHHGHCASKR